MISNMIVLSLSSHEYTRSSNGLIMFWSSVLNCQKLFSVEIKYDLEFPRDLITRETGGPHSCVVQCTGYIVDTLCRIFCIARRSSDLARCTRIQHTGWWSHDIDRWRVRVFAILSKERYPIFKEENAGDLGLRISRLGLLYRPWGRTH